MERTEARELLLGFAQHLGLRAADDPDGDAERFREAQVDAYLSEQGGALGYTDDELKGTARDEACGRLLVGRGDDTYDPKCVLPAGHGGSCEPGTS